MKTPIKSAKIKTEFTVCAWCIETVESRDDVCDDCQDAMFGAFMRALYDHQDEQDVWNTLPRIQ